MSQTRIAVVAAGGTVATSLPMFVIGANGPTLIADFGITTGALGLAAAAFSLGVAGAAVLARMLVDSFAPTVTIRLACAVSITAAFAVVLSPSWTFVALACGLAGAANSLGQAASSRLLATAIAPASQGIHFGIFQSAKPGAALVAGILVPIAHLLGTWRASFVITAAASALIALIAGGLPGRRQASTPVRVPARRDRRILALAVLLGLGFAITNSSSTFVVDYATEVGYSHRIASMVLVIGGALAILGRLTVGWLSDRYTAPPGPAMALVFGCAAAGLGLLAIERPVTVVIGAMVLFGLGWAFAGLLFLAVAQIAPTRTGRATGFVLLGGAIGGAAGPAGFGLVIEQFGYPAAWAATALLAVVAASIAGGVRTGPDRAEG